MKETTTMAMVFLLLAACGEGTIVDESLYPATVAVSPETAEFRRFRATVNLTATVRDQNGNVMNNVKVEWSSEDTEVAEVSATGVVTAFGTGATRIVATAGQVSGGAEITVSLPQRDGLVEFYESLNGDSWTRNDNWKAKTELSEWFGVETDEDGNVTTLDLTSNKLNGELPAAIGRLEHLVLLQIGFHEGVTGSIPPEIGELKNLSILRLHHNGLTGSLPREMANLVNLRVLDLHHNPLAGPLPEWLGDLSQLGEIRIWGTTLSGPLPASLGNLTRLKQLYLYRSPGLSGPLPRSLMNLDLGRFFWEDTNLCSPPDEEFQNWLSTITYSRGNGVCDS